MKPRIIFTQGVSASGKSTWARNWIKENPDWVEVNRDLIREGIHLEKTGEPFSWTTWNRKCESKVTGIQKKIFTIQEESKRNIVCSDTNLNVNRLSDQIRHWEKKGYEVSIMPIKIDFDTAVQRDNARANGVGAAVIRKQWQQWIDCSQAWQFVGYYMEPGPLFFRYTGNPNKPKCLMVDLDGTLAHMHNRSPYDWDRVGEDSVDPWLSWMISQWLSLDSNRVVFLSGRDDQCRDKTIEWIKKNVDNVRFTSGSPNASLFMRPSGDNSKDTIVKRRLFMDHVMFNFDVVAVFDDRPSVVRMWHDLGLKVWACGDQLVEF